MYFIMVTVMEKKREKEESKEDSESERVMGMNNKDLMFQVVANSNECRKISRSAET